jgi:hypothetical protein
MRSSLGMLCRKKGTNTGNMTCGGETGLRDLKHAQKHLMSCSFWTLLFRQSKKSHGFHECPASPGALLDSKRRQNGANVLFCQNTARTRFYDWRLKSTSAWVCFCLEVEYVVTADCMVLC